MNKNNIEDEILENLKKAIDKIDDSFYHINSVKGEKRARERVFCYELYHQLRLQKDTFEFDIHGELDKRGFYDDINMTPDFLFHKQGSHENYCIMEVKGVCKYSGIIKDFKTLDLFLKGKGNLKFYKLAIFLLFNESFDTLKEFFKKENLEDFSEKIIILCKKDKTSIIEEHTLKDLKMY